MSKFTFSKCKRKNYSDASVTLKSDGLITSTYGSLDIDTFLKSSTLNKYLDLGTQYRLNVASSIAYLHWRHSDKFTKQSIIDSLNVLFVIISRTHATTLQSNYTFLRNVIGSLMYSLIQMEGSSESAMAKLSLNPKTVAYLSLHKKFYE